MTPPPCGDRAVVAIAKLRTTASTAAVGLGLVTVKLVAGWGIACPFRALTGWRCPLCGATTMGVDLVKGQFSQAWHQNEVCFVGLGGLLACCVWWGLVALGRVPGVGAGTGRPGRGASLVTQQGLYLVAAVTAVAWVLARNLVPSLRGV